MKALSSKMVQANVFGTSLLAEEEIDCRQKTHREASPKVQKQQEGAGKGSGVGRRGKAPGIDGGEPAEHTGLETQDTIQASDVEDEAADKAIH